MAEDGKAPILAAIRAALGRGPLEHAARTAIEARFDAHVRNLVPARTDGDAAARIALFEKLAKAVSATVTRVTTDAEVPGAVTEYLAGANMAAAAVMAPDPALDAYPWADHPLLTLRRGVPVPTDAVGIAAGFAGIAETGTLMLVSGPASPTTLNFLPETQIVVLRADRVVGPYEDAWDLLRRERGPVPPRSVNLVTGPSRTGDIELTIQLGVHGPRRLLIVLVGDPQDTQG